MGNTEKLFVFVGGLHPLVWFEMLAVIGVLVFARDFGWRRSWLAKWDALARRRRLCLLILFCTPIVLRLLLLLIRPMPAPGLHDEFGNLLIGDTFAQGRLANPTHPFWIHFETFHVVQQPRYFSFRPPGPGLFLAPFIWVTGSLLPGAWAGVIVSMGLMSMSILWALYAWLPPRWALLGAALAVVQIGVTSYWMNSYWGGEWAALGGALVLGGFGRFRKGQNLVRNGMWMVLGAGIAGNTRQLESGVLVATTLVLLFVQFVHLPSRTRLDWLKAAIPACGLAGLIVAAMLTYNYKLTGNSLELPYRLGLETYKMAPTLSWEKPLPVKHYNHEVMQKGLAGRDMREYREWTQTPTTMTFLWRMAETFQFYVRPALGVALLALPWIVRDRRFRPLLIVSFIMLIETAASIWFNPHYIAPATAAFYGVLVQGLRHLRASRSWRWTAALANAAPVCCVITLCLAMVVDGFPNAHIWFRGWCGRYWELTAREEVRARLESSGGDHLVLVRYGPEHDTSLEWVYNRADINGSRIVWAREMDPQRNRSLVQYFSSRKVWILQADAKPPLLEPYPAKELAIVR
jgi:hypothetical protein